MPNETRVYPAARMVSKKAGEVDSGLASVVTSAPGASTKCAPIASSTSASPEPPSRDGVPPPTNTVSTGGFPARVRAANSSSARNASSQPAGEVPSPSSSAV
ncbi:Uncharacterised protein [Mycobacteroides abscessus subsp. massiliense]|nr:Uncharacterised protein [Mycobacteroides abscessus subsp. massiliense]